MIIAAFIGALVAVTAIVSIACDDVGYRRGYRDGAADARLDQEPAK